MTVTSRIAAVLLVGSALSAPAAANTILFSTGALPDGSRLRPGEVPPGPTEVVGGVTQILSDDGDVISIVGDGSFDASRAVVGVTRGRVTVTTGSDGRAAFAIGSTINANVAGQNATASFTIDAGAITAGRVLGGQVSVGGGGVMRSFDSGQAFAAARGNAPYLVRSAGAAPIAAPIGRAIRFSHSADVGSGLNLGSVVGSTRTAFLASYSSAGAAALQADAIRLQNSATAFDFKQVSDAYLDVNLASVNAGQALGAFDPGTAAIALASYIRQLRQGIADTIASGGDSTYQRALLSYFARDGVPVSASELTRSLIDQYIAYVGGGGVFGTVPVVVPTPTPTPTPTPLQHPRQHRLPRPRPFMPVAGSAMRGRSP